MFFKLNVSIIGSKGTYYYFIGKGLSVYIFDNITHYAQERLEKKIRRIGF